MAYVQVSYTKRVLAIELMQEAMQWAEGRCETIMLFTKIPALYENISFRKV